MKIVFINTQYVETDATSFKSVVQRLTGKDSVVGIEVKAGGSFASGAAEKSVGAQSARVEMRGGGSGGGDRGGGGLGLSRGGMSFKELDRLLLLELPPLDELNWLCVD